ncbi:MAG: MJ0042-type zinc finger domain-containing protein [Planctomycetaceae bacterium]
MSISVRCPECDAVSRVPDEKAGKKVRCKQCSAVIVAVDDLDVLIESPVRRSVGGRQRRGGERSAKQPPWVIIGGIAGAVLLLVVLVIAMNGGGANATREWVGDPVAVGMLDREVNLNGYAIRPPRDWTVSYNEIGGAAPTVKYIWTAPDIRETLTLEFRQDARYHPNFEPHVVTKPGIHFGDGSGDSFYFLGATHDRGTINGQKFQRIFSPQNTSKTSGSYAFYLAYFQGLGIKLSIESRQSESSASFKSMVAAALTFRIGQPSDSRAVPVQQLLAAKSNPGSNIPGTPSVNNAPNGVARPPVLGNRNSPSANSPNNTSNNIPTNNPNNGSSTPAVKRSGAIPELSNVGGGQASYLSYAYQRPALPGVFHIYPDETYQPKVVIPVPPSFEVMSRPVTASDFLLVGSQVWNVKTAERVASLGIKINHGDFAALSPDGKLVAFRDRGNDAAPIGVFSTEQRSQTVELAARKGDARLEWLGFLDATRLMVVWRGWNDTRDNAVQIWNAETGEGLSAFGLGPFGRNDMSVSSDGEQMLFHTSDTVGYVSLTPKKPKPTPLPMPDRRALFSVNGLAFSPDNSRAAIYRGDWEGLSILEWDVTKKKIVQNGTIPINASDISVGPGQNDAFQWTPDGKHWLVKGHLLLECKSGNPVWMLQSLPGVHVSPIMLDEETLLVPVQSKNHRDTFLVSVPFPWEQIRRATAAMNDPAQPALLRPGASVSMEFNPGPLRFMPAEQMAQVLGQPLAERLKTFGVKVEANQPTVLYVKYNEQTGDTLQVVEQRSPFDFRGTPTGQTVNETKYQLEIGWKKAGTDRVYWKTTSLGSTARSTSAATVSDQSLHQEMVDRLKRQLNSLMIPYYIPEDPSIPLLPTISSR